MHPLAFIFPCYNPAPGWELKLILFYREFRHRLGFDFGVVVADDGSVPHIDPQLIAALKAKIPHFLFVENTTNQGKGAALRSGLRAVEAQHYIYCDLDLPFTDESVWAMWQGLQAGYELVCGDRGSHYADKLPLSRKFISACSRFLNRHVLRLKNTDTQGGLKAFNPAGKTIFLQTRINRFLFDTEFIYLAEQTTGLKMLTIPIQVREEVHFSDFGIRTIWTECKNFLFILLR